jgi:hypothetical protein
MDGHQSSTATSPGSRNGRTHRQSSIGLTVDGNFNRWNYVCRSCGAARRYGKLRRELSLNSHEFRRSLPTTRSRHRILWRACGPWVSKVVDGPKLRRQRGSRLRALILVAGTHRKPAATPNVRSWLPRTHSHTSGYHFAKSPFWLECATSKINGAKRRQTSVVPVVSRRPRTIETSAAGGRYIST